MCGERIGFGLYQSCRNRGVWDVCVLRGVGGWLGPGSGRVGWCYVLCLADNCAS